jgi:hypothetical protein
VQLATMSYRTWRPGIGVLAVRASLGKPKWIPDAENWPAVWEITPRGWYFHDPGWEAHYLAQLRRYGVKRIVGRFAEISRENGHPDVIAVCCFEANPADCHRAAWARWMLQATGEVVPDLIIT